MEPTSPKASRPRRAGRSTRCTTASLTRAGRAASSGSPGSGARVDDVELREVAATASRYSPADRYVLVRAARSPKRGATATATSSSPSRAVGASSRARTEVPRLRLAVALLVPEPAATEIDGLRRALGDPGLGNVVPHITLITAGQHRGGPRSGRARGPACRGRGHGADRPCDSVRRRRSRRSARSCTCPSAAIEAGSGPRAAGCACAPARSHVRRCTTSFRT